MPIFIDPLNKSEEIINEGIFSWIRNKAEKSERFISDSVAKAGLGIKYKHYAKMSIREIHAEVYEYYTPKQIHGANASDPYLDLRQCVSANIFLGTPEGKKWFEEKYPNIEEREKVRIAVLDIIPHAIALSRPNIFEQVIGAKPSEVYPNF
jgi:hypothetical protein